MMIIWLMMYLSIFLSNMKELNFINSFSLVNSQMTVMMLITPMVLKMLLSMKFMNIKKMQSKMYKYLFVMIVILLNMTFISSDAFMFILMMEMCVYPMMILILNFSKEKDKMNSMIFMFNMNMVGSIPFIFYVSVMMSENYTYDMNLETLNSNFTSSPMAYLCYTLLMLSKLPIMFLHFWLNKAHVSASGSSSMILASLMLKLGSFGLFKFYMNFLNCSIVVLSMISSYTLMGMLFFNLIMIRFFDIKYMMACSSVVHMAMIFPLVSFSKSVSMISSIFMMVGHGLISFMMFYFVTIMYENSLNRSMMFNKSMESMNKNMGFFTLMLMFMNLGLPPFLNFYSEILTLMSMFQISKFLSWMCGLTMIIPIIFLMMMCTQIMFGKKSLKSNMNLMSKTTVNSMLVMIGLVTLPLIN